MLVIYEAESKVALLDYMKHLNEMGITAVGDVALTGESPDDIVYPKLYASVENDDNGSSKLFPRRCVKS